MCPGTRLVEGRRDGERWGWGVIMMTMMLLSNKNKNLVLNKSLHDEKHSSTQYGILKCK